MRKALFITVTAILLGGSAIRTTAFVSGVHVDGTMFASPEAAAFGITAAVGLPGMGADSIESCFPYGEFIRTATSCNELKPMGVLSQCRIKK